MEKEPGWLVVFCSRDDTVILDWHGEQVLVRFTETHGQSAVRFALKAPKSVKINRQKYLAKHQPTR